MKCKAIILACFLCLYLMDWAQLKDTSGSGRSILFASDTQAPMWVETLLLKPNRNREATRMIFSQMAKENPRQVFILGDVVNLGYSNRQWKPIDHYINALRKNGVGVDAILGNHEVMGRPEAGEAAFQKRFPNHVKTGYVELVDSVAVVLLNSNFSNLTKEEDKKQTAWYKRTLTELDENKAVKFIITCCHHSPFTNSKVVKPSVGVRERFVPAFLSSRKSGLFLSGHCHGFEHFKHAGKDFLVIGGGGGLHQPLRESTIETADLSANYKPAFHYVKIQVVNNQLVVKSIALKKDFWGFEDGAEFSVKATDSHTFIVSSQPASTAGK